MTTVSITFVNSKDRPIFLQVDPWAGWYLLKEGDRIEIVAESENPSFVIDESSDDVKILTILDSTIDEGYHVVLNGERVHHTKYLTDHRLCPYCLGLLNPEESSIRACHCGKGA